MKELFGTLVFFSGQAVMGHGVAQTSEGEVFLPNSCFRQKVNGTEVFYRSQKERIFPETGDRVVVKIPTFATDKVRQLCACHWAKDE